MQSIGFGAANAMFSIIPIFVIVIFIFVFLSIGANMVKGANTWKKNNDSPILTVEALVVAKRAHVSHYHGSANDHSSSRSSTTYFVTFQFESGDRLELELPDEAYGLIVENDRGNLTFQGTRFLEFKRTC